MIEALGNPPGRHTIAEVATATNLTRATARRILSTLVRLNYCENDDERHFKLRPRTLALGLAYLTALPFWGQAQRTLETLRDELKESTALAVLDRTEIIYIARYPARNILPVNLGPGSRLPAHLISLGRVLLAALPASQQVEVCTEIDFRPRTPKSIGTLVALRRDLNKVNSQGYAWVDGELDLAICGMSVPLTAQDGKVVAAISVNAVSGSLTQTQARSRFLSKLKEAAQEIRMQIPQTNG